MRETDYLKRVVFDLLHYRAADLRAVEWLTKLKHNAEVCPLLERQLNLILDSFERYHRTAGDAQGVRDRGTDVFLRYKPDPEENGYRFINFQVKTQEDLSSKGYLQILKSQCLESLADYGGSLDDYYVLLATHTEDDREQNRAIRAELAKVPKVTVLGPEYTATFLRLSAERIAAYVKAKLSQEDTVVRAALESVVDLAPTEVAVVVELVSRSAEATPIPTPRGELEGSLFLSEIYQNVPDVPRWSFFEEAYDENEEEGIGEEGIPGEDYRLQRPLRERLDEAVGIFEGDYIQIDAATGNIETAADGYLAVQALALDARVRYGYAGSSLRSYLASILGIDQYLPT